MDVRTSRRDPVDAQTLAVAAEIVGAVRDEGLPAVLRYAERYGDLHGPPVIRREELDRARAELPRDQREVLERTAERIRRFAEVQKRGLTDVETEVPGGRAGLRYAPVERAGCYAPGGRYPLPSSVLMTAVTAQVAGVKEVWVASPRPAQATLAAASIAGADALLAVGGAQAIAALAYGAGPVPPADAIVGPGNRWVTAAKQLVSGRVRIDMLAGPSELVVVADASANPAWVAADLIAQAEHDPEALPILVALDEAVANRVDQALEIQDQPQARAALARGFAVVAADLPEAIDLCDRLAPEHLALHLANAGGVASRFSHYGALFIGEGAAEVFGDYGVGPNHVLPTGGTARSVGALSVSTFLRVQTWLTMEDPAVVAEDAAALARMEGLEGHALAAEYRVGTSLPHHRVKRAG